MTLRRLYQQVPWLLIVSLVVGAVGLEADTYQWLRLANGSIGAIGGLLTFIAVVTARPLWHCLGWGVLCLLGFYAMVDPQSSEFFWEIVVALADE